ncbi:MAG: ATP-dependent RNA helicase HrpA [Propionibacteriaceae bacterium]|nr:ATP-dependent RNA helicase HrpA [Propionibacteriaceae bacterium]
MSPRPAIDLTIDPSLPVAAHEAEIAAGLLSHQVLVVAGETGSGKTTQLPKILLKMGYTAIGHTQPRRIAARSVAQRIAQEIGSPLGEVVGYQVRFTAHTSEATQLKLMTDGIMLAQIAHDSDLRQYDAIIVDEAHERSLNIDFLLGYLKQLLYRRPELKVVITSATIDTARFAAHFDNAPVVEVSGRGFPVEVRYLPPSDDRDLPEQIVAALATLPHQGDVLVFCAGERDIKEADKAISAARHDVEVLPLFARLTLEEQARVFAPHQQQRVVLATNVAETSLTVPGVRYVIDPGLARISRYSARTKVQRLPIEEISQASARQRAGRCGRVAPGICLRLYSQDNFEQRPAFTDPEMLRTNLASVILAMANASLGPIEEFPFVEAPDQAQISDGLRLLVELGAIVSPSGNPRLTRIGRQLAGLPIDPRLARMVIEANRLNCLRDVIVIVAALSIQDVRERPADNRGAADACHARFWSDQTAPDGVGDISGAGAGRQQGTSEPSAQVRPLPAPARITPHTGWKGGHQSKEAAQSAAEVSAGGDIIAWLRLWRYLKERRRALSGSAFRRLCKSEWLNYQRVRQWIDLVDQLRAITKRLKLTDHRSVSDPTAVLTACLAGLLSQIGRLDVSGEAPAKGRRRPLREYIGARSARFVISPGSSLAKRPPELVMAVELIDTNRLWAHTVAAISPSQVEAVGQHLLRRSYSEPFFAASSGSIRAHEQSTLLGVIIRADRLVDYAQIDPVEARRLFIQSGLVEGQLQARQGSASAQLMTYNRQVVEMAEQAEDKLRRRGGLIGDLEMADWFDVRLPATVNSAATLERWLRADDSHPASLQWRLADLQLVADADGGDFPDHWVFGQTSFELDYHFAPGQATDGVTVKIPLSQLASLDPAPFTWGVPGQRLELATSWIKTLPKATRRRFVPAADWAGRALDWLSDHQGDQQRPFVEELARALQALDGGPVIGFDPSGLPEHLRMRFLVAQGGAGQVSRDLSSIQAELNQQVAKQLSKASGRQLRSGQSWVFGHLPATVTVRQHGVAAVGYPALADQRDHVTEQLATTLGQAQLIHAAGLARLVLLALPEPYKWVVAHLTNPDKLALATSPYPSVPDLLADARLAAIRQLIAAHRPWEIRSQEQFDALVQLVRPDQVEATMRLVAVAADALGRWQRLQPLIKNLNPLSEAFQDISTQVDNLIFPNFLQVITASWLPRLPYWLKAVEARLIAYGSDQRRDQARMDQLTPVLNAYDDWLDKGQPVSEQSDQVGYLIEELRIQLFAQTIGTSQTVSVKRLLKAIADLG